MILPNLASEEFNYAAKRSAGNQLFACTNEPCLKVLTVCVVPVLSQGTSPFSYH